MTTPAARIKLMRVLALLLAGVVCILGIGLLTLMLGTPAVSPRELVTIAQGGGPPLDRLIVTQLRLPRLVLGLLAGAMLGLSGTLLQDTMRNPLGGPELLGVTSGATIVVAAITLLHLPVELALIPWLALAGGLAAGAVVVLSVGRLGDPIRLVLTGAALTALLNAGIFVLISYGNTNDIALLYLFLVGSLANRTWNYVRLVLPWAIVGIPAALLCARALNLLQLGDEVARGLGLPVGRVRLLTLTLGAALVAAVVAVAGPISFIGLLAPHLARRLLRTSDARQVLPLAALLGALLLAAADLLARRAFAPLDLPVGVFTTLLGGPVLLVLLRRSLGARPEAA
ncbi:MAG TPA: iron ABC transporter permease [Thermomicrobiaceae bacterium]|nr:iron ABC transporter permease [Thermomicrobiaceae bacterium]